MSERKLTILYGSQTGTAQEVAERIWRESKWFHFHGPVLAMDDYPIKQLIYERLVIFVCSTTGQGEEPDNMKHFWRFLLRRNLPANSLQGLQFGVLGLGDSSYQCFNYAAKKLSHRLAQLGGTMLRTMGLADDQHDLGYDFTADPWISGLWTTLAAMLPVPATLDPVDRNTLPSPRWLVSRVESDESDGLSDTNLATVLSNTRTTAHDHWQDVRLLSLSSSDLYRPGDVVSLTPHNLPAHTEQLLTLLEVCGISAVTKLKISASYPDVPVPAHLSRPVSVRECAEKLWDLSAVPRRYLMQLLSHFTSSDLEREKLIEFTTPQGQEELYNYANRPRRTVMETLLDFPHASQHIPLAYLFEIFQPIRPRSFSIASSPSAHAGELQVLVAVVKYKTKLVQERLGLCSNFMASLRPGDNVPITLRSGTFKFPTDTSVPVIMVGPGTGVAPFRSYVHERCVQGSASSDTLLLFFGCRREAADFHCRDEWTEMKRQGQINLFAAFSRDQPDKVYVQHVMAQQGPLVWDLLSRGAHFYVAGSSKDMPQAVRDALVKIIAAHSTLDPEEYVQQLETSARYQCETWA